MTPPSGDSRAFTLIEILVACAVGAILLVALTSIVGQSLTISKRSNNVLLANNAASAAVELVARDIESLAASAKPYEYLHVAKENVDGVTDVARLLMLSYSGFYATNAPDYGQVRAISYRLLHQDPINPTGTRNIYGLYRSIAPSGNTFSNYLGQTNLAAPFGSLATSLDDFLVGNVIDFQIRVYPDGNQPPANASGNAVQPVRLSGNSAQIQGTPHTGAPLRWAEVSLTILEDRDNAVSRFESGELGLEEARSKYGFRLSRRVPVRAPIF